MLQVLAISYSMPRGPRSLGRQGARIEGHRLHPCVAMGMLASVAVLPIGQQPASSILNSGFAVRVPFVALVVAEPSRPPPDTAPHDLF